MPEREFETTVTMDEAVRLAVEMHRAGRRDQAEPIYEKVLEVEPDHVDALHFLGFLRHQQGRDEEGIELIRRALERRPDYADARNNLGNILRENDRLAEAEVEYRRALADAPRHSGAWNNLGTILRRRGDMEGAIAAYRKSLDISANDPFAWLNLGNAYRAGGRGDDATEAYREVLRRKPDELQAYVNLGQVLYTLGRTEEAAVVYREWLAQEPENPVAQHMLAACTGDGVPGRASDDFVRKTFDAFSSVFDETLGRLKYRAPQLVAEVVAEERERAGRPLDVLDAGCGTGLCGPLLRESAGRLAGVDLSEKMVEKARARRVYDDLSVAELVAHLGSLAPAFDAVVAADVFVYFGELGPVFRATAAAMRPGGIFVFTTELVTDEEAPDGFRLRPHGRYCHAPAYLEARLRDAGLEVVSLREAHVRLEAGDPVSGTLAVARKPATA